jgi:hypothetical protein
MISMFPSTPLKPSIIVQVFRAVIEYVNSNGDIPRIPTPSSTFIDGAQRAHVGTHVYRLAAKVIALSPPTCQ